MNVTQIDPTTAEVTPTKKRIMIVDDDLTASQLLKLALEQTGQFELLVENKSTQALSAARGFQPDLVVMDVCMPNKNGGDVAAEIRADSRMKNVAIIFLTSIVSEREAANRPVISGGYPFLAKPVRLDSLLQLIAQALPAGSGLGRAQLR